MAGIYIHIPFCKKACHYCDFHFSTSLKLKEKVLSAMLQEIELRSDYLRNQTIETIYFGGGSPSILEAHELASFLQKIDAYLKLGSNPDITLEANPDDLSKKKLVDLKTIGVTRLSIGIQSFRDVDLELMNRAHNENMARNSVELARDAGFDNLNLDLIYGIPDLNLNDWVKNAEELLTYDPEHISAYSLTIEDRTAFGKWFKDGRLKMPEDDLVNEQFRELMKLLAKNNYDHYEISNFCKPGFESKHNTSYWKGSHYLGIGPSAHSYNGISRSWNMRNNPLYVKALDGGKIFYEDELLSEKDRFNEYILTSLRTKWGLDLNFLGNTFEENMVSAMKKDSERYLINQDLRMEEDVLFLTEKGKLVADKITSDLFAL